MPSATVNGRNASKRTSMSVDTEEGALFARVAAGDQDAFRIFLEQHLAAVLSFTQRFVRDRAEAEDITQETFSRVWQHAANWQDQGLTPRSWLYRIARNLCIDTLRQRRVSSHEIDELPGTGTPEQIASEQQQARQLRQAIEQLPEQQRSALCLSVYQGLSQREAAAVLDISVRALESLLARARRSLCKTCMTENSL